MPVIGQRKVYHVSQHRQEYTFNQQQAQTRPRFTYHLPGHHLQQQQQQPAEEEEAAKPPRVPRQRSRSQPLRREHLLLPQSVQAEYYQYGLTRQRRR